MRVMEWEGAWHAGDVDSLIDSEKSLSILAAITGQDLAALRWSSLSSSQKVLRSASLAADKATQIGGLVYWVTERPADSGSQCAPTACSLRQFCPHVFGSKRCLLPHNLAVLLRYRLPRAQHFPPGLLSAMSTQIAGFLSLRFQSHG